MNAKDAPQAETRFKPRRRIRFRRSASTHSLAPERTTRVWSLLLPPTLPTERK